MEIPVNITNIRQQVEESGFALVPDVLSQSTVDQLIMAIDKTIRNQIDRSEHAMRHLTRAIPEVRELANSPQVRELAAAILGTNALVVRSIFFDKTPEANWKVAWHQDLTIAVREKTECPGFTAWSVKDGSVHVQPPVEILGRMLTVRLHLDDCGPRNGPLLVIPASHNFGRLGAEQIRHLRENKAPVVCAIPCGGALLMRPLLLHASSRATSPKHRRVVHLEFAAEPLPGGLQWL